MRKLFIATCLLATSFSRAAFAQAAPTAPGALAPEILWDTWGVPHIYAATDAGAFKAFGYAQMQAHGDLILKLYGQARGRAAEYWGESHLTTDRFVRTLGITQHAAQSYRTMSPALHANVAAFAAGINAYVAQHPDKIADSVKVVLPVTATDVVAHTERVIYYLFMLLGQVQMPSKFNDASKPGSNMWAISAGRSASGHPMLLGNPHLPWSDLYLFFESQITAPGRDFYGTTLVGFPVPVIGFNNNVGWSHTVNTQDGVDDYTLTPRGNGYLLDGAERAFTTRNEILKIKSATGLRTETMRVRTSVHGPVFDDSTGTLRAVRIAGLDDPNMLEQWWKMGAATSMKDFESAVRGMHVPFFNIMAASHDGHIYYFFGGKTPKRVRGDGAFWRAPVRGDSSALIWKETLAYDQLPHVMDPPSGWLQNANDPPWTVTWPLVFKPDAYAAYVAPREMSFRPQRSASMLMADSSITFDELVQYKHSTHMLLADRVLPELLAAVRITGDADAKRAAVVLAAWDGNANADSRGAVLFSAWVQQWLGPVGEKAFARPWRLEAAVSTPAGLADPARAVKALSAAALLTEKNHHALDVAYGDVNRLRYAGKDLPGNGAAGDPFGVFRVGYYAPQPDGKSVFSAGDSYYQAVEFGTPLRAKVLTAYGNASQPSSPHRGDQLELFAAKQMRDVWRTRAEVLKHLESKDVIR